MTGRPAPDLVGMGIAMMLAAYLLFSIVDTSAKWLLGLGFPALQLVFLRYAGHFIISAGLAAKRQRHGQALGRDRIGLVILRGGTLVVATVGNFVALNYLPLTVVSAIMFSAPIIVCLLSVRFLGENVGPWRWSAIILGFAGVLVVIQPFGETFHWTAFLCVGNAILLAVYSILTRRLAADVTAATMQFYGGAVGTVALAPAAFIVWEPATSLSVFTAWCALGLAGWAGHELLTRAHGIAPANLLMPFSYSFLIYMMIADIAVFGYLPNGQEILGISIIVAAGLVIWRRGRQPR